ncbi:hypothetical protein Cgig2_003061 [Carnegiea gigantea]|uniref:Uncharacterized protein n=1 Tax=Carnegiea gigantea TaxID=171969 RepID=A0A9Q1JIP8_9CARY|nr:hypothetical protein Cgig2_003061 [Carnegiea gigantea]
MQSVAMLSKTLDKGRQKLKSIIVCTPDEQGMSNAKESELGSRKVIFPPLDGAKNIIDIMDCDPNPIECMLNRLKSTSIPNDDDEAESTRRTEALLPPPSFKSFTRREFDSLYGLIYERGGDATPLKNKVERLIQQARDLKDQQEMYSDRMTIELEAVQSRHEELLKEFQSLEDQKKGLNSSVVVSEHLLQEIKREVIDLQGQIDKINAAKVIDLATKASLEKTEAYVKESLKTKDLLLDPIAIIFSFFDIDSACVLLLDAHRIRVE